jgi:hypothetical protein
MELQWRTALELLLRIWQYAAAIRRRIASGFLDASRGRKGSCREYLGKIARIGPAKVQNFPPKRNSRMFGFLRLALTFVVCILIVGFFLGWFSFTQGPTDPQTNKVNINVSVDKNKMGTDLQKFKQNVSKGIDDINKPDPNAGKTSGQTGQQPAIPGLSLGPVTVTPAGQSAPPPSGSQPQIRFQTQDYQFSVPLGGSPPPGEGR